jgi:hypothetical protein
VISAFKWGKRRLLHVRNLSDVPTVFSFPTESQGAFGSGTRKSYGQPAERYTHVSQKAMGQIRSPLDRLDLSGAERASKKGGAP